MGKRRAQQQFAKKAEQKIPAGIQLKQGRPIEFPTLEIRCIENGWEMTEMEAFVAKALPNMSHRWYITWTEFGFKLYERQDSGTWKLVTIKRLVEIYREYRSSGRTAIN